MERVDKPPLDEIKESKYSSRYIEDLFSRHPDDELLARMWEVDPSTMIRLMPDVGYETQEEIDVENSHLRGYINFALNSLRITVGKEMKLTPRQRMREAFYNLDNADSDNCLSLK